MKKDIKALRERLNNATGGLALKQKPAAGKTPRGLGLKKTTDINEIAAEYASQDSPFMRQARTDGMQYAASRGLLNSSMAAGAAQGEVVRRAIDMAGQTSQQRFSEQENRRDRRQQRFLQDDAQEFTGDQNRLAREQERWLQDDSQAFTKEENAADRSFEKWRQNDMQSFTASQNAADRKLEQWKQNDSQAFTAGQNKADRELERWRVNADRNVRVQLANMEIDASDRKNAAALFDENNKSYQQSVQSIMSNPDLRSSQRNELLRAAGDKLEIDNAVIKSLYGVNFNWKGKSFDPVDGSTNKDGEPVGRNSEEYSAGNRRNDPVEREEPKYIKVREDGGWRTVPNPKYKG